MESLSQPRCIKRVKAIYDSGYDVEVYGYTRGFYDINLFPDGINVTNWGKVESGSRYMNRLRLNYNNILSIIKKSNKNVLYYAFGFDLALILSLFSPKKFIYESSDLIYTYFKEPILSMFKTLDKYIIKKSYYTIFTSEGFADFLYKGNRPQNIIIQSNKVSAFYANFDRKPIDVDKNKKGFIFSYVGAFRYPNTVFRFAKIIGDKYPNHKFYFYGDSNLTPLAKELATKYKNVKYFGKFKNPEDLKKIYSQIDIVIACYDTRTINEQIAEPNKLYEAICFCRPIIVSIGTFLAKQVEKLNVGFCINACSDDSICEFLDNLEYSAVQSVSINEYNLDKKVFIDSIEEINNAIKHFHK